MPIRPRRPTSTRPSTRGWDMWISMLTSERAVGLWAGHKIPGRSERTVVVRHAPHTGPEALGRARRSFCTGRAGPTLRRPPPGPRGHLAPGVRGLAHGRPARPPARPERGDDGPQR